MRPLIMYIYTR